MVSVLTSQSRTIKGHASLCRNTLLEGTKHKEFFLPCVCLLFHQMKTILVHFFFIPFVHLILEASCHFPHHSSSYPSYDPYHHILIQHNVPLPPHYKLVQQIHPFYCCSDTKPFQAKKFNLLQDFSLSFLWTDIKLTWSTSLLIITKFCLSFVQLNLNRNKQDNYTFSSTYKFETFLIYLNKMYHSAKLCRIHNFMLNILAMLGIYICHFKVSIIWVCWTLIPEWVAICCRMEHQEQILTFLGDVYNSKDADFWEHSTQSISALAALFFA